MQERQVTVEGQTFPLEAPFHVLATANPVEYEGTYPLPEAQLDRFLMRVALRLPDAATRSGTCCGAGSTAARRSSSSTPVTDAAGPAGDAGGRSRRSTVEESVGRYCVALAAATRDHPQVLMGSSPRGALGADADRAGATP